MRPLATRLHQHFTVYTYDRRGRGDSGDTSPHTVTREIEDLQALITAAGGTAHVYAISSGAALALATAAVTPAITRLALYEPPFTADFGDPQPSWAALAAIAPTLAYDDAILAGGRVPDGLASITIPALVLAGGSSPHDLQQAAKAVADALPGAGFETLRGQTHDVHPDALAPALIRFFTA
jgi:pimeloyl-ACP methyl ester carboxylesterase